MLRTGFKINCRSFTIYLSTKNIFMVVFLEQCRKAYLNEEGHVNWNAVQARWNLLKNVKICLANKYFTPDVRRHAETLDQVDQQRLLDIIMGGL